MGRSSDLTRNLDGIAGRLAATFLPRRFRPMPAAPRRIVLLQPTAIGDTLIASGAVAAIARRFPDSELLIAHGANNAAAVKMLTAPLRPVQIDFSNPVKAVRVLRALKPEMVVDLTPWPYATALSARLTGAWSAGFAPTFGQRGRLFDLAVPHRTDRHELDNLEAMARALGVAGDCGMAIRRDSAVLLEELNPKDLVLCHVSAGGARAAAKAWPVEHWVAFIKAMEEDGYRIGFTGAPWDKAAVDPILARSGLAVSRAFSLCGRLSLASLAELLAVVPLLVSVDTGVLHLSAAVKGRAIGLHGPTKAARWGSVSPHACGLDAPHPAAGFVNYGWEDDYSAMEIMRTLTPDHVIAVAREMLDGRPAATAGGGLA